MRDISLGIKDLKVKNKVTKSINALFYFLQGIFTKRLVLGKKW